MADRVGRGDAVDRVIAAWTALAVGWCLVLGVVHRESPAPAVTVVVTAAVVVVLARHATRWRPALVPAVVVALGLVVAVLGLRRGELFDQLEGPLGYANATAALATVVAAAALVLRTRVVRSELRLASLVVALAAASVPAVVHSWLGFAAALVVLAGAVPAWRRVRPAVLVRAAGAATLTVAAVVVATAAAVPAARALGVEVGTLPVSVTERARLWHRALELWGSSPLVGVGRGGFVAGPPAALAPWERYAHAEHLQLAATGGAVALGLLVVAVVWLLRVAARGPGDPALPIGLALLVAVGGHAAVDYVGHASLVRLSLVAMLATTLLPPRSRPADPERARSSSVVHGR